MVYDDVIVAFPHTAGVHGIVLEMLYRRLPLLVEVNHAFVAHSASYEAHNNVARINLKGVVFQADAIARSRLPQHTNVRLCYAQRTFQLDSSVYVEDDGSHLVLAQSIAQRALYRLFGLVFLAEPRVGAIVLDGGNMINLSAASAGGVSSVSFGSRKCRCRGKLCFERCKWHQDKQQQL